MGYYNLMGGKSPLQGHFKYENIIGDRVYLPCRLWEEKVILPPSLIKTENAPTAFYVGREKHKLIESAKEQFLALQSSSYR